MIYRRLNKHNRNFIAMAVGETGSGKSWGMISLAERVSANFNINHIVFTYEEFIELLHTGNLERGDVIVWDEAGVAASSREFQTKRNRHIGKIAQTFRHRNLGLLMTVPNAKMVDLQLRMLTHVLFTARGWNKFNKLTRLDVTRLQHNEKLGKTYFKSPVFNLNGTKQLIKTILLPAPSRKIRRQYEKRKSDFTSQLNKQEDEEEGVGDEVEENKFEIAYKYVVDNLDVYKKPRGNKRIIDKKLLTAHMRLGKLPAIPVREIGALKRLVESEYCGE